MLKSQQQVHKSGGKRGRCILEPASHSHWHWPMEDLLSPEKRVHYTILQERGIFRAPLPTGHCWKVSGVDRNCTWQGSESVRGSRHVEEVPTGKSTESSPGVSKCQVELALWEIKPWLQIWKSKLCSWKTIPDVFLCLAFMKVKFYLQNGVCGAGLWCLSLEEQSMQTGQDLYQLLTASYL